MEILDIVNEKDEIIGNASYDEVHDKGLLHRIIHVLLINKDNKVLLQLRSAQKRAYPLHWSFSAGGHVRHGETYKEALSREIEEELGIVVPSEGFELKGEGEFINEAGHRSHYKTYEAHYNEVVNVHNEEVERVQLVDWDEMRQMIAEGREKLQPEMVMVLKKHWKHSL